jgi:GNAT superfamily N-acetyltransferase
VTVRPAVAADAAEIARLLTQLGHAASADEIAERWPAWAAEGNEALVAAGDDGRLAGLATLGTMRVLHRGKPVGRVTALVVDASVRGRGIGRSLVVAAEARLAARGCGLVEVTTNRARADAHAFYARIGYEPTSLRFAKSVAR